MRLCLSCFLRHLSTWKLALMGLVLIAALSFSHYGSYLIGVLSEQARLAVKWEKLADDSWKLRPHRP